LTDVIALHNIKKTYHTGAQSFEALKGINLSVKKAELVAIMGASGSGKSTLLNILGLLDKPSSGEYFLSGTEVAHINENEGAYFRNQKIGFIFQSFFLLPRFTALQNVMLPLNYREMNDEEAKSRAITMLGKVGIDHLAHARPNQMSGGQQQRVAIARALVCEPDLILADEPTGALDTHTSDTVMQLLLDLNQNDAKTIVVVTHDSEVSASCERTIHLQDGMVINE